MDHSRDIKIGYAVKKGSLSTDPKPFVPHTERPTCSTCNGLHTDNNCFLTHPEVLADFLATHPDKTAYWTQRVAGYQAHLDRVAKSKAEKHAAFLERQKKREERAANPQTCNICGSPQHLQRNCEKNEENPKANFVRVGRNY